MNPKRRATIQELQSYPFLQSAADNTAIADLVSLCQFSASMWARLKTESEEQPWQPTELIISQSLPDCISEI